MTPEQAWKEAVRAVGSPAKMAKCLGISRQRLSQWKVCKAEFVFAAEKAVRSAMKTPPLLITRFDMRPDMFPTKPKGE